MMHVTQKSSGCIAKHTSRHVHIDFTGKRAAAGLCRPHTSLVVYKDCAKKVKKKKKKMCERADDEVLLVCCSVPVSSFLTPA